MPNSIYQITENFIKKVQEVTFSAELSSLDDLTTDLQKASKEFCKEMTEAALNELNQSIRDDRKLRKENGLTIHSKDRPRSYLTEIGEIHYARDCYLVHETGKHTCIMDRLIGVDAYDRVGRNIGARLVSEATENSYAQSSRIVTGGTVSRQTVRNKILKMGPLEYPARGELKQVKELHIYADEDHAHLQKPKKAKGKKLQINPLAVVTEGTKAVASGRNKTICPMRFVDHEFNSKRLWNSVEGYLRSAYDMDYLEKIYLHADGGSWIKIGLSEMKQKVEVLDGFHLEKYIMKLVRLFPNSNTHYRITNVIKANDKGKADKIFQSLLDKSDGDTRKEETVKKVAKYILGHWDAAVLRKTEDIPGSCTEGQISHVLSSRFSREPLGWSKEGLGSLSSQRVYIMNGGNIKGSDFRTTSDNTYADLMEKCLSGKMNEKLDWSIIDAKIRGIFDTGSGTQQVLKSLGQLQNVTLS